MPVWKFSEIYGKFESSNPIPHLLHRIYPRIYYFCSAKSIFYMDYQAFKAKRIRHEGWDYLQYDLVPTQTMSSLFSITEFHSKENPHSADLDEMHSHGFYSISWFYTGEGEHHVDFNTYPIEKDTLFFLAPKYLHSFSHLKNISGISIIFSEDFLLHLTPELQNRIKARLFCPVIGTSHCKIPESAKERLGHYIKMMQEESDLDREDKTLKAEFLASALSLFLIDVMRLGEWEDLEPADIFSESYLLYQKFATSIEDNFTKCHVVQEYLHKLNVSKKALNHCTLKYAKTSPLKMINGRIILEAKRLLWYSSLRMKEIASKLGFKDTAYLTKVFEREVKMSPAEFKDLK